MQPSRDEGGSLGSPTGATPGCRRPGCRLDSDSWAGSRAPCLRLGVMWVLMLWGAPASLGHVTLQVVSQNE